MFDQHIRDHCQLGGLPNREAVDRLKQLNQEREDRLAKERVYRFLSSS